MILKKGHWFNLNDCYNKRKGVEKRFEVGFERVTSPTDLGKETVEGV